MPLSAQLSSLQGERGFEDLTGVDYCEGAIELARQCTKMKGVTVKLLVSVLLLDIEILDLEPRYRYDRIVWFQAL